VKSKTIEKAAHEPELGKRIGKISKEPIAKADKVKVKHRPRLDVLVNAG
jgi:hypothetical protein